MHDLSPVTALGADEPVIVTIGNLTITENDSFALASVTARAGHESAVNSVLKSLLGEVPKPGRAVLRDPENGFWMGSNQWMIGAPYITHEMLADTLRTRFSTYASVTEQSDAWVCFDVAGTAVEDMCERLCAVPIRQMVVADVRRTVIHQIGCYVIRQATKGQLRIFGPRASAKSLHNALVTTAGALTDL